MKMNPLRMPDRALEWLDDRFDAVGRSRVGDLPLALFLLAPVIIILGVFGIWPLFSAIKISLYGGKWGMGGFVGLGNYAEALGSETFWRALTVTAHYVVGTIPAAMVLSFFVATLLHRIGRGRSLYRTLYFLPYVTSAVAAAMVWRALLNPQFGLANTILERIGSQPAQWLLEPAGALSILTGGWVPPDVGPSLSLCCVMLFDIWHGSGFMIVVFLAGLSTIPKELEESARMDGAGPLRVLRHVTLPMLSPTVFFLAVVSVIKAFQAFNSFYALTGNGRGPVDATMNVTVHIYSSFYEYQRWGYGAAVATLLCCTIVILSLVQWRFAGRKVYYE